MIKVIEYSNDLNMYNLCSDNLKKDYNFVKFLVLKYSNDSTYIYQVADYFLDNTTFYFHKIELIIIMSELIPNSKYGIMIDNIYLKKRLEIDEYLNKEKDLVITNELGKGFIFILDLYTKSDIILSFYAQKFIADILKDIDFAKMVHTKYRTDVINNLNLNSYIINLLKIYDASLASYVSKHLEVLSFLNINNALENHSFEEEPERYNLMFAKVHEYLVNKDSLITEMELLSFISNELGITEEIRKYTKIGKQMLTNILNNLSNYFDTDNISLIDKVHYNNVKKIMINALFSQSISHEKSILR